MCKSQKQRDCINELNITDPHCPSPCSGLVLTSYHHSEKWKYLEGSICSCYENYTKWLELPSDLKGDFSIVFKPFQNQKFIVV